MTDKDKVRSVVARFFNVPEAQVTESFVFPAERLHGSVGRATFCAAIKRMAGADLAAAMSAKTFGELFVETPTFSTANKLSKAESGALPMAPLGTPTAQDVAVGIDIEHVENLPAALDPWTEAFYAEYFTKAEIAYCQRQPNPRESFCGLWCAKEAVLKCGREFRNRRPLELEIGHDIGGRPFLTILTDGKPVRQQTCALSITHSHGMSVAVCIVGNGSLHTTYPENRAPASQETYRGNILAWVAFGLGILNVCLWLLLVLKK